MKKEKKASKTETYSISNPMLPGDEFKSKHIHTIMDKIIDVSKEIYVSSKEKGEKISPTHSTYATSVCVMLDMDNVYLKGLKKALRKLLRKEQKELYDILKPDLNSCIRFQEKEEEAGQTIKGNILVFALKENIADEKKIIHLLIRSLSCFKPVRGVGLIMEGNEISLSTKEKPDPILDKLMDRYNKGDFSDGLANPVFDPYRSSSLIINMATIEGDYIDRIPIKDGLLDLDNIIRVSPDTVKGAKKLVAGGRFSDLYVKTDKEKSMKIMTSDMSTLVTVKNLVMDSVPSPYGVVFLIELLLNLDKNIKRKA